MRNQSLLPVLGIFFFGALWGLSETFLGEALYTSGLPLPSLYLTLIGFAVLGLSRAFLPRPGTATAIALLALLYKGLATNFYCHLAAIGLAGLGFDLCFSLLAPRLRLLAPFLACLTSGTAFGLMMTFLTNNGFWNSDKLLGHIGVSALTGLACALAVPLALKGGEKLRAGGVQAGDRALLPGSVSAATLLLWALSLGLGAGLLG